MKSGILRTNLFTFLWRIGLTLTFLLLAASITWAAPLISSADEQMANRSTTTSSIATATGAVTTNAAITATTPASQLSLSSRRGAGEAPVRLQIPTLTIDAVIEAVGRDADGAMGIPAQVDNVAWYAPGYLPGELGNAVIAGHLDRANGAPAIFWSIDKLTVGDPIIVTTADGTQYHFAVTHLETYPYDQAPIEAIFGFSLRSQLNLITCKGQWNSGQRNYSNRLVVYSELVETVRGAGMWGSGSSPVILYSSAPPLPHTLTPSLPIPEPN